MISSLSDLLGSIQGGQGVDPLAIMNSLQQQGQPQASSGAPTGAAPIDTTGAASLPAAAPGNVLARLRSAQAAQKPQMPQAPQLGNAFQYSGVPDVRGMSKGAALATGLASGLKDLAANSQLRQAQQSQNFQNQLLLYKQLFDMQHQTTEEGIQKDTLAETRRKDLAAEDPALQGKLASAKEPDSSSKWQKIGERVDPDTGTKIDVMGYPPATPKDASDDDTSGTAAPAAGGGAAAPKQTAQEYLRSQGVDNTSAPVTRGMMQGDLGNDSAAAGPSVPLPDDQKARLNSLNPNVANHVEAILQGRETMPKLQSTGTRQAFARAVSNGVLTVNPQFDGVRNQAQVKIRQTFMPSGANNAPGTLIQNGDAALDHLATLMDASRAMPNYGSTGAWITSGTANVTGGRIGGDFAKAQGDLDTKAQIAATEAIKYLAGTSSGGGVAEREKLMTQFSSAVPPEKREAAMKALGQDILEKKIELQSGWRRGMGPEIPDFDVISPNSVESVRKLGLDGYFSKLGGPSASAALAAQQSASPQLPSPAGAGAGASMPAAPAAPPASVAPTGLTPPKGAKPITLEDSDAGKAAAKKLPSGTWVTIPGIGTWQTK